MQRTEVAHCPLSPSCLYFASNANVYDTVRRDEASAKWPSKLQGGVGTRVGCAYIMTPPKKCELLPVLLLLLLLPSLLLNMEKHFERAASESNFRLAAICCLRVISAVQPAADMPRCAPLAPSPSLLSMFEQIPPVSC